MLSDHDIAQQANVKPIADVAADLGVDRQHLIPFGDEVTKVSLDALAQPRKRPPPRRQLVKARRQRQ